MSKSAVHCAIYTRKSSDEGLDQAFNSLDAQHEACSNYIASQRHEGWKVIKTRYDDGGVSGATIRRPSLQRLLEDIDAGRVQMVVVYKIDRLTRSLADFAKLVERLEAANCSFVSVTQSFNTSSSMGRLTLNVLLSFAQFEREVTAERIRDKIAASKQKGLWMGGCCPLGYDKHPDPHRRTLIINTEEGQAVTRLFELYDENGCLRVIEEVARQEGIRSKRRLFATGKVSGGRSLSRGQIYYLLRNPIYIGEIRHKDRTYEGEHDAIVPKYLWDRVQEKLSEAGQRKRGQSQPKGPDVFRLTGKVEDETGDRLTPTSTNKGNRRHRYYVSSRLMRAQKDPSGWRLSAPPLEQRVASLTHDHLVRCAERATLIETDQITMIQQIMSRVADLARAQDNQRILLTVARVFLSQSTIRIALDRISLANALNSDPALLSPESLEIQASWQIKRRGVESKIVIGDEVPGLDQTLIRLLNLAHQDVEAIKQGIPLTTLAKKALVTPAYIRSRSKLAFLSPEIQQTILSGRLDPRFTANRIMAMKIPMDWGEQASLFLGD